MFQREAKKVKEDKLDCPAMHNAVMGVIFHQMSAKQGIKKFGQRAIDALFGEFAQLDDMDVFRGVMASSLSAEQKRKALMALNLIKEKRDGTIKDRLVANGAQQRPYYSKVETTSPTVSNDAMMMTLIIDAMEARDVAIADIKGAYLHAEMKDFVLLKMTGESVQTLCKVNPKYKAFVTTENGKEVIYLELLKALYGCVQSALLWYELYVTTLKDLGFELNPYDMCVANKMIDGKQCTIGFWVDDNKISHVDPKVVTNIIKLIEKRFGKMVVTRGKEHTFLGMKIKFNGDKTVSIDMKDYCKKAISDFTGKLRSASSTPAKKQLFTVDETSPL